MAINIEMDTNIQGTLKLNNKDVFDLFYPINSIYISTIANTNPKTLFGFGEWTRDEFNGRSFISAAYTSTSKGNIGYANHTTPSHTHTVSNVSQSFSTSHSHGTSGGSTAAVGSSKYGNTSSAQSFCATATNSQTVNVTSGSSGSDWTAHNHGTKTQTIGTARTADDIVQNENYPPYKMVYIWRRTA